MNDFGFDNVLKSLAALAVVCALGTTSPYAFADPPDDGPSSTQMSDSTPSPPPDNGTIASAEPGILHAPDDWILSVSAKDEVLLPVAPLTTALSSREYLASGTFMGTIQGSSRTKPTEGELEAGYQIGCGITADVVDLRFGGGLTPTLSPAGVPSLGGSAFAQIRPTLKPGTVNIIPVTKKQFKGSYARVTITGLRIKIDSCVGQSFIRSYAIFSGSTDDTHDMVTYVGVTKAV